ncbi:MAG: HXXEE domain-containing protein [Bacteroidales bacterium]
MNSTTLVLIGLPVLFLLHSLTELFVLKPLIKKSHSKLPPEITDVTKETFSIFPRLSYQQISLIILEEFILATAVTCFSLISGMYYPWIALVCSFFFYLIIHIANWLSRMYFTPAIITTFIGTAFCIYAVDFSTQILEVDTMHILILSIIGTIFCAGNLYLMIRLFEKKRTTDIETIE